MEEIKTLSATPRTKKLDYEEMRKKAVKLMDIKMAIAWAYKPHIVTGKQIGRAHV